MGAILIFQKKLGSRIQDEKFDIEIEFSDCNCLKFNHWHKRSLGTLFDTLGAIFQKKEALTAQLYNKL